MAPRASKSQKLPSLPPRMSATPRIPKWEPPKWVRLLEEKKEQERIQKLNADPEYQAKLAKIRDEILHKPIKEEQERRMKMLDELIAFEKAELDALKKLSLKDL